jgi:hypothetical protein
MGRRLANRSEIQVGLAALVAVLAFLALNLFLSRPANSPPVIAAPVTVAERTIRHGQEQSAKDWRVTQKRSDARNASERARRLASDDLAQPH